MQQCHLFSFIYNIFLSYFTDSRAKASFDLIICKATEDDITSLHGSLLKLLKPSGSLFAAVPTSGIDVLKENLKLTGFININEAAEGNIQIH